MLRLIPRMLSPSGCSLRYSISNWKLPGSEIDTAGLSGFLESRKQAYLTVSQKIAEVMPGELYTGLDEWSRELLITLSTDYKIGLATSIIAATVLIKTIFLYPALKGQAQGLRQQEIKGLMSKFQEKMKTAQMTNNKHLMMQANYQRKIELKRKGINNLVPMINILQVPILITWFLSIRYMSNLPEIYPQILSEGYLWFSDLSTYDPYFVLPVLAACSMSLSIVRSPNLAQNNISMPFLKPYVKYMKFLPFVSLAITGFFPASLNLYWMTLSLYQLGTTQLLYVSYIRRKLGVSEKHQSVKRNPGAFAKAVVVEDKMTSGELMEEAIYSTGAKAPIDIPSNAKVIEVLKYKPNKKKKRNDVHQA